MHLSFRLARYRIGPAVVAGALGLLSVCAAAEPWIYVANNQSNTVSIISTESDEVIFTVRVGREPHEVAVTPDGKTVFVTNAMDDTVAVIEASVVIAKIPTGRFPHGVAVTPDGSRAYVTNFLADSVTVIDTRRLSVVETLSGIRSNPRNICIAPDGRRAYITTMGTSSVTVLDLESHQIVSQVPIPGVGDGVGVTRNGKTIYVASRRGDTVHLVDGQTLKRRGSIQAGLGPNRVVFSPDGRLALVPNMSSWNVTFVDTSTETPLQSIHVGGVAVNAVVAPNGEKAYATVFSANGVVVIDMKTRAVSKRIPTGRGPDGIAVAERPLGLALRAKP